MKRSLLRNTVWEVGDLIQLIWSLLYSLLVSAFLPKSWNNDLRQREERQSWNLPDEIVRFHLIPLLPPADIANLYEALQMEITEDIYNEVFHDGTKFDDYNLEMFRERIGCRLYIIRDKERTDFGLTGEQNAEYECAENRSEAAITSGAVDLGDISISQVCASPESIELVTSDGQLQTTKRTWFWNRNRTLKGRQLRRDSLDTCEKPTSTVCKTYFNLPMEKTHFISAVSSESDLVALDSSGMLWHWYKLSNSDTQGVPFILRDFATRKLISGSRIKSLRVGGGFFAALIEGVGITGFRFQVRLPHPNCWRNGYPCVNGQFCTRTATIVTDNTHLIRNFEIGGHFLMYMRSDGDVAAQVPVTVPQFEDREHIPMILCPILIHHKQSDVRIVSGNSGSVVLTDETGKITTLRFYRRRGYHGLKRETIEIPCEPLAAVSISGDLAAGHALALTEQGEVYSWRAVSRKKTGDSRFIDTFRREHILNRARSFQDFDGIVLTKLSLPGRAYGVFTGDRYSAVLLAKDKGSESEAVYVHADMEVCSILRNWMSLPNLTTNG